ncbi:MAG: hypothetical protein M1840_006898 [Geoglossum simile]|nr:MAG: hypothetical protein M1840_006898 [Geoglossum simile]
MSRLEEEVRDLHGKTAANKKKRTYNKADDTMPPTKRSGTGVDNRPVKPTVYERNEPAKAFECLEGIHGQDKTSWQEYKTFLKDLAQDPVTRASTMVKRYDSVHQRSGQTVTQFVNYLNELESEMSPYSESQRYRHLLAKLLPELRRILNSYQSILPTRQGLIALAVQVEANLAPKVKGNSKTSAARQEPAREFNPKGKGKARMPNPPKNKDSNNALPASKPAAPKPPRRRLNLFKEERERHTKGNLCYLCGKEGVRH